MSKKYLVIKDNVVIATILWDGISEYTYPEPHDKLILDEWGWIGIGDWYEESEDIFYRPILRVPPQE